MKCDVLIVGGGTGGVAAALALADKGLSVILTEETDWLGGQLTSQIVPPDEHPWIESFGCTRRYRLQRQAWRHRFAHGWESDSRSLVPSAARAHQLNPGGGWVSKICVEPRLIAEGFLADPSLTGNDRLSAQGVWTLFNTVAAKASVEFDRVKAVELSSTKSGERFWVEPRFVLDATELGDILPLTRTEYVSGAESTQDTGEPHALTGPADRNNVQSFTWCAAVGYDTSGDHTISKPDQYDAWRSYQPPHWTGNLLDLTFPNVRTLEPMRLPLISEPGEADLPDWMTLFKYRQIVDPGVYSTPVEPVTVMNWPQNDYMSGHVIDVDETTQSKHYESAKQLTLSVLYWLQTELGFKGLRLRPDVTGTDDGLAKAPYHRESRRIKAMRTVVEQDVSPACNPGRQVAPPMEGSVGIGAYRIDLHPSATGAPSIDIPCLPFQIPLGALIPVATRNLLPACKNIGTTHITNGCYRLHPVEWNIGEAAGLLAFYCLSRGTEPHEIYGRHELVAEFQQLLVNEGLELAWPALGPL